MFEDKTQPQDNQSNLDPTSLNEDNSFPFKKVEPSEKRLSGTKGPVEDILAGTESDREPVKEIKPEQPVATEPESAFKQIPQVPSMERPSARGGVVPPTPQLTQERKATPPIPEIAIKKSSNFFIIILAVLIVVILGLAGVFAYQYFIKSKSAQSPTNLNTGQNLQELLNILNQPKGNINTNQNTRAEPLIEKQEQGPSADEGILRPDEVGIQNKVGETDSDNDGLTDEQEIDLGTNPNKFDTDDDSLSDFEEVEIYKTNPVKDDTDGDGYIDGNEVEHGYDPLRPGSARL